MSKWRPTETGCLYVIPDIHGAARLLDQIFTRILPLRKSEGIIDKIIFLGDYIDRGPDSPGVLDRLIKLHKKQPNQVEFLFGNHELYMFKALGWITNDTLSDSLWLRNGGDQTILQYIKRSNLKCKPFDIKMSRVADIIPNSHKEFLLNNTKSHHREGEYIFVHGGCDPYNVDKLDDMVYNQDLNRMMPKEFEKLCLDRKLVYDVMDMTSNGKELDWDDVIVTGHNKRAYNEDAIITDKFMMLDCASPKKLLVTELYSMEAFMAYANKKRMVKYDFKEFIVTQKK